MPLPSMPEIIDDRERIKQEVLSLLQSHWTAGVPFFEVVCSTTNALHEFMQEETEE